MTRSVSLPFNRSPHYHRWTYHYAGRYQIMKTVQLTLEDDLVTAVDRVAGQRRQQIHFCLRP